MRQLNESGSSTNDDLLAFAAVLAGAFLGATFSAAFQAWFERRATKNRRHGLVLALWRQLSRVPYSPSPLHLESQFIRSPVRITVIPHLLSGDTLHPHRDSELIMLL